MLFNNAGMQGNLAKTYANLIHSLYSGSPSYAPRDFKMTISRFNSTFQGYGQQDSQELLGALLDGLHEDLNRIVQKPYIELGDLATESDGIIARETWDWYKKRNESIIVDTFMGGYLSRVQCLDCEKKSVTFDPFMFLGVPVPDTRTVDVQVCVVDNGVKKTTVRLPRTAKVSDLKSQLSYPDKEFLFLEVKQNKIGQVFDDSDSVSSMRFNHDLFLYPLTFKENIVVPIYFEKQKDDLSYFRTFFGIPLFVRLPKEIKVSINRTEGMDDKTAAALIFQELRDIVLPALTETIEPYLKDKTSNFVIKWARKGDSEEAGDFYKEFGSRWSKADEFIVYSADHISEPVQDGEPVEMVVPFENSVFVVEFEEEEAKRCFGEDVIMGYGSDHTFKVCIRCCVWFY